MGQWERFTRQNRGFLRLMQVQLVILLLLYLCMYPLIGEAIFIAGLIYFLLAIAGLSFLLHKYRP